MIPFNKLIEILKYKCQENGIGCIEQEESYTSKASFLETIFQYMEKKMTNMNFLDGEMEEYIR